MSDEKYLNDTDYLTWFLRENPQARKEILNQMLHRLELHGECRAVYHRLAYVLVDDAFSEE